MQKIDDLAEYFLYRTESNNIVPVMASPTVSI